MDTAETNDAAARLEARLAGAARRIEGLKNAVEIVVIFQVLAEKRQLPVLYQVAKTFSGVIGLSMVAEQEYVSDLAKGLHNEQMENALECLFRILDRQLEHLEAVARDENL